MNLGIFFKKNAPAILTGTGLLGVVATAVMSSYDHGKYVEESIKLNNRVTTLFADNIEYKVKNSPSKKEKAIVFAKSYWRTALVATATGACIIFSNRLDAKKIATLTAAVTFAEKKFDKYRDIIKEKLGEEEEKELYEESMEPEWHMTPPLPESDDGDLVYFYDTFTEQFFKSSVERVQQAMYHINRQFQLKQHVYLSEFQEFLGFKNITDLAKTIGWSDSEYLESGLTPWIDFYSQEKTSENGVKYYAIYYDLEPSVGAMKDWM